MATRGRHGAAGLLALLLALVVLAGCSGGSDGDSASSLAPSSANEGADTDQADEAVPAAPEPQEAGDAASSRPQAAAVPSVRAEVLTAAVTVRVKDVEAAAREAEDAALAVGGSVGDTQTRVDPDDPSATSARLRLRVDNGELPAILRTLADLGTRVSEDRTVQDVTAEVADVASRVANQEAAIARLRGFLREAERIEDVLRIETDLSRREAELEALQARNRALADRTAQATVDLTLISRAAPAPLEAEREEDRGFLAGLRGGWDAFVGATTLALTIVGAVLPFAILAVLLALPLYLLRNRVRRLVRWASTP